MFRLVRTRTRNASRKLARDFASLKPFPGDRVLAPNRSAYLRRELEAGRFHGCDWAVFHCLETGENYRVNGKHTSHLLADDAISDELVSQVRITLKYFEGKTLQDGAECYQTFDDSVCSRTVGDINRSTAACILSLAGLPSRIINLCVQGMSFKIFGSGYSENKKGGKKERSALLFDNQEFCLFVYEVARGGDFKPMRRGPVAAAMYKSFQESPELAKRFWEAVRDGTNPDHTAVDRDLQRYLMLMNLNIGSGARGGTTKTRHVTRDEMYNRCVKTWETWCGTQSKHAA